MMIKSIISVIIIVNIPCLLFSSVVSLQEGIFTFTEVMEEEIGHIVGKSPDKTTLILPTSPQIYKEFEELTIENVTLKSYDGETPVTVPVLSFQNAGKITFRNCIFDSIEYSVDPAQIEEIKQVRKEVMARQIEKGIEKRVEWDPPPPFIEFSNINNLIFDRVSIINIPEPEELLVSFLRFTEIQNLKVSNSRFENIEEKNAMRFVECGNVHISESVFLNNSAQLLSFPHGNITLTNNLFAHTKTPFSVNFGNPEVQVKLEGNVLYNIKNPIGGLLTLAQIGPDFIQKKQLTVRNNFIWKTTIPLPVMEDNRWEWKDNYFWHHPGHFPGNHPEPLDITKPDNLTEDPVVKKFLNNEKISKYDLLEPQQLHVRGETPEERGESLQRKIQEILEMSVPFGIIHLPPEDIKANVIIPHGGIILKGVPDETRILNEDKSLESSGASADYFDYAPRSPDLDRRYLLGYQPSCEESNAEENPFSVKFEESAAHLLIGCHVFDVEFIQEKPLEIMMYVGAGTKFAGCSFQGSTWGIHPIYADVLFEDCQFRGFGWQVLDISGLNWVYINRSLFENNILLEDIAEEIPEGLGALARVVTSWPTRPPNIINVQHRAGVLRIDNSVFKGNFVRETDNRGIPLAILNYIEEHPNVRRDEIVFRGMRPIMLWDNTPLPSYFDLPSHFLNVRLTNYPLEVYNTLFTENALLPIVNNTCGMLSFQLMTTSFCGEKTAKLEDIPFPMKFINNIIYRNPFYKQEDRYQDPSYRDLDPETEPAITYRNCLTTHRFSWSEGNVGNIAGDPLWRDPERGDFTPMPDSPLIDAGISEGLTLSEKDMLGNPRIVDGTGDGMAEVDIGPVEWQGEE